jgi:hypothetical protein
MHTSNVFSKGDAMQRFSWVLILSVFFSSPLLANTWHVPDDAPTIQAGVDAAAAGDTVLVACGTYFEHDIVMKSGICLRSETGNPDCVTIDAGQAGRVMEFNHLDSLVIIQGFHFTGGQAPWNYPLGGAIAIISSQVSISYCIFSGNRADAGGALTCSAPEIGQSVLTLSHCTFDFNEASYGKGGAISADAQTSLVMESCLLTNNEATFGGGAIVCRGVSISHCTFAYNSSPSQGGAICLRSAGAEIDNSIVAFSSEGEGIYCFNEDGPPNLTCCDIIGNQGGDWTDCIADQFGVDGNISEDPLFCGSAGGDFHLHVKSPCATENNPGCGQIGALPSNCCGTSSADDSELAPRASSLTQNHPNPFNPQTTIAFEIPDQQTVTLRVFEMSGRLVRNLIAAEPHTPGRHEVVWNGRDDAGRQVASGTYFYRLEAGSYSETKRMVLVK